MKLIANYDMFVNDEFLKAGKVHELDLTPVIERLIKHKALIDPSKIEEIKEENYTVEQFQETPLIQNREKSVKDKLKVK